MIIVVESLSPMFGFIGNLDEVRRSFRCNVEYNRHFESRRRGHVEAVVFGEEGGS